jgi:hypothetical protein
LRRDARAVSREPTRADESRREPTRSTRPRVFRSRRLWKKKKPKKTTFVHARSRRRRKYPLASAKRHARKQHARRRVNSPGLRLEKPRAGRCSFSSGNATRGALGARAVERGHELILRENPRRRACARARRSPPLARARPRARRVSLASPLRARETRLVVRRRERESGLDVGSRGVGVPSVAAERLAEARRAEGKAGRARERGHDGSSDGSGQPRARFVRVLIWASPGRKTEKRSAPDGHGSTNGRTGARD